MPPQAREAALVDLRLLQTPQYPDTSGNVDRLGGNGG